MTRSNAARVAGYTFLAYIVIGVSQMIVSRGLPAAEGAAARLLVIGTHLPIIRINMLLGLVTAFIAITLGAALYSLTRDEDRDLAAMAFACRAIEGALIVPPVFVTLSLIWLATEGGASAGPSGIAIAELLLKLRGWNVTLAALFFAVGSTIFSWLLLRGRIVPVWLAKVGVAASVLLVVGLPLQLAGVVRQPVTWIIWVPMAVFEIVVAVWLIRNADRLQTNTLAT